MNGNKIAEYVERVFFPSTVSIVGGLILIFYLWSSIHFFNNILILLSSIVVYFSVLKTTKKRIKSETRKYTFAAGVALIYILAMSSVFTISEELKLGLFSLMLITMTNHFIRDVWKISGHAMTYSGVSTVLSLVDIRFLPMFALLPVVAWGRLKLKRHDLAQVIAGSVVGVSVPLVVDFIMKM